MQSQESTMRRRPLRRLRELICLAAALTAWAMVWAAAHSGFEGRRGYTLLAIDAVVEIGALLVLFLLEWRRPRRRPAMPWITMAWLSIPFWVLLEVLGAVTLRATA